MTNGLNQITSKGGTSFGYDSKGNLTSDGTTTYSFDSQNQPKTISGTFPATLTYDPLGRAWEYAAGTGATRYAYEGSDALTQQDQTGTYWRRYVHGPATIEPLVQYQDQNAATRRFLATDERGSVIALSDDSGNVTAINRYDEYGVPQAGNANGFGYAGQKGSGSANDDNARYYRPGEGVFMQTDPIGPEDDANLYQYTGNDPVNEVDPSGLCLGGGGSVSYINGPEGASPVITCPHLSGQSAIVGGNGPVTLLSPVVRRFAPTSGARGGDRLERQTPRSIQKNLKECGGGNVVWTASGASIIGGIGGGAIQGAFVTDQGGVGAFETDFWGIGLDLGAVVQGGWARNIDSFTGLSVNFSANFGRWGGTAARSESTGRWAASGTRSLPAPALPAFGGALTESNTFVTAFVCVK